MSILTVEGSKPLIGDVRVSGSKNASLFLIYASVFTNKDVILTNVPHIKDVITDLKMLSEMGVAYQWVGNNKLLINSSEINTYEIPFESGSSNRLASLLAGALLYRFGKIVIPKPNNTLSGIKKINRLVDTWKAFNIEVTEDDVYYYLNSEKAAAGLFSFRKNTVIGTVNAVLSSISLDGESIISNASQEHEVDELISFCNLIGANVERISPKKIKVIGNQKYVSAEYTLDSDILETVTFATAALLTKGNLSIHGVNKLHLLSFVNVLNKIDARFEFFKDTFKVWYGGEKFNNFDITVSQAPGFLTDWHPLMTLLATQIEGISHINETIYTDRFSYIKDLLSMGADIALLRPSDEGFESIVNDDSYDESVLGEPRTLVKVRGITPLNGTKIIVSDLKYGAVCVLAALCAQGESSIAGYENIERGFEDFSKKLETLGAKIEVI